MVYVSWHYCRCREMISASNIKNLVFFKKSKSASWWMTLRLDLMWWGGAIVTVDVVSYQ
jgi:hypothetical protein